MSLVKEMWEKKKKVQIELDYLRRRNLAKIEEDRMVFEQHFVDSDKGCAQKKSI